LGTSQQVPGDGFPNGRIVVLRTAIVVFFPALNTVFARGRRGGMLAGGGKQQRADGKREAK